MTLPIRTAHDGLELPAIGFGTHRVRGLDGLAAIRHALESAYRLCPGRFGETVPKATRISWPECKSLPLSRFLSPPLE